MSTQDAAESSVKPTRTSGVRTVLRYTGIPPSWLDKRPKLPSRNWLIFLSVTSSLVGYYAYDRRECKRIRQEYIDKVQALSEETLGPLEQPRKVVVYGSKWPGDDDYEQGLKYFRKYVKPILVAAAIDFDMISGKRLGDIAKRVAEDIRLRRRVDDGVDQIPEIMKALPTYTSQADIRRRELEGGIVLIGRPTFKEFMAGLKRGWTNGLEKVDEEEVLANILENDRYFDEVDEEGTEPAQPIPHVPIFTEPTSSLESPVPGTHPPPPAHIPQLPPILLVPFANRIGFSQIPAMIWDWFNRRYWVQSGAEAGYRLVTNHTRPINVTSDSTSQSDLDFDQEAERLLKNSLSKIPEETEKIRKEFYEKLPARLATARELSRGLREPTKDELQNPPPTEVELRAERMKNERKWRYDVEGWNLVKPSAPVVWDERFQEALRIFTDQP